MIAMSRKDDGKVLQYDYKLQDKEPTQRKTKLLTALVVVMPLISLLAGAALAAHQYGVL